MGKRWGSALRRVRMSCREAPRTVAGLCQQGDCRVGQERLGSVCLTKEAQADARVQRGREERHGRRGYLSGGISRVSRRGRHTRGDVGELG